MERDTLIRRLAPLLALPDGTLAEVESPLQRIRIIKAGAQIHFYFVDADTTLNGPMSRIDLRRPLYLLADYTQMATLALLWRPQPQRACLIGLAGGRISLVLHHHLPQLVIDNVEIDPAVGPLAECFFGLIFDHRQRLIVADAWAHLLATPEQYDFIVMDAFSDATDDLDQLASPSFYGDCQAHLVAGGVVVVNMLKNDPHYQEKRSTFVEYFRYTYLAPRRGGAVLFGCDELVTMPELMNRATEIQRRCAFEFPFVARAAQLRLL